MPIEWSPSRYRAEYREFICIVERNSTDGTWYAWFETLYGETVADARHIPTLERAQECARQMVDDKHAEMSARRASWFAKPEATK